MVVDTSALIAILLDEPDAETLSAAISSATPRIISAVSALEASIVIESKKGEAGLALLDELLSVAQFEIVAFDDAQQQIARVAYRRYGKGRHPAGLNFGDLLRLCACQGAQRDSVIQGQRLQPDGHHSRAARSGALGFSWGVAGCVNARPHISEK